MDILKPSDESCEVDRRNFMKSCGRFATTVPPAMTLLLSTSLNSNAIAKSTGAGDLGSGSGHGDSGHTPGGDGGHVAPVVTRDVGHREGGRETGVARR